MVSIAHKGSFRTAAAGVVATLALAGCSARSTGGHAVSVSALDCARSGFSSAAAGATVRCYFSALASDDTDTACRMLSTDVRAGILRKGRDDGYDSAYRPASSAAGCGKVAAVMHAALHRLPAADIAELCHALRHAQIGPAEVTGADASLSLSVNAAGRTSGENVHLIVQGGAWRIDSSDAFSAGG